MENSPALSQTGRVPWQRLSAVTCPAHLLLLSFTCHLLRCNPTPTQALPSTCFLGPQSMTAEGHICHTGLHGRPGATPWTGQIVYKEHMLLRAEKSVSMTAFQMGQDRCKTDESKL